MTNEMMSLKQIAEYFGVSHGTVRGWRCKGLLPAPAIQVNKRVIRWKRSDIEAWKR